MPKMQLHIATDLSPTSLAAMQLALGWAQGLAAKVVFLHVVHDPELAPALSSDVPGDVAHARQQLLAFVAEHAQGLECQIDVRTAEDIAAAIVAASAQADYVFVGSHGRSGFERLRLGSIATAVLRRSTVPVVCMPAV